MKRHFVGHTPLAEPASVREHLDRMAPPEDFDFEKVVSAAQPLVERLVRHMSLGERMPKTLDLRECPRLEVFPKGRALTVEDQEALDMDFEIQQTMGVWTVAVETFYYGGSEVTESTLLVEGRQGEDLILIQDHLRGRD